MGKVDTMRAFVNLSVVRRIREDTNIAGVDWCDFIHRFLAISHELNTYLEIEDEAFGKLEIYGEWSENETVEAEGFCEYALVLPHTDKKIICEMIEEKLSSISKEKAEVETLLRDANKEFPNDDNVKQLFEQYKGFFKETPAATMTKEAAEKPMPTENVKELAEKPKEPADDDYQGNIDWVGEVIDIISAAYLDDELHAWPRVVEPVNMVQPSTPKQVFSSPSKEYVKPVKTVNTHYMCRRIDVTARCRRIEFVLGNSLFAMEGDKYETVFQSLGGYRELSSVRVNMETLAPTLWIDANVIDCWVALLNFEELALGYPTPTRHFFPTGCINQGIIKGTLTEEEQWKSFYDEIKAQFKYEHSSMLLSDFELVFFPIYASDHFYVVVFNIKKPKTMVILDNSDSGYTYASKYKEACDPLKKLFSSNNRDPPKQVKETDAANVVVGVNEVVDQ
nr:hypothetical protein [Tanacetum cinerariifolium]